MCKNGDYNILSMECGRHNAKLTTTKNEKNYLDFWCVVRNNYKYYNKLSKYCIKITIKMAKTENSV